MSTMVYFNVRRYILIFVKEKEVRIFGADGGDYRLGSSATYLFVGHCKPFLS